MGAMISCFQKTASCLRSTKSVVVKCSQRQQKLNRNNSACDSIVVLQELGNVEVRKLEDKDKVRLFGSPFDPHDSNQTPFAPHRALTVRNKPSFEYHTPKLVSQKTRDESDCLKQIGDNKPPIPMRSFEKTLSNENFGKSEQKFPYCFQPKYKGNSAEFMVHSTAAENLGLSQSSIHKDSVKPPPVPPRIYKY